jgi:hypothetical protein
MAVKLWKHSTKPTTASKRSVEMGTRLFLDGEQFFHFWALAPAVPGVRRNTLVGTTEFVWLIEDETREIWQALVDKESDRIYWRSAGILQGRGNQYVRDGYQAVAA